MSDHRGIEAMTAAQKVIAQVLAQHQEFRISLEESMPSYLVRCQSDGQVGGGRCAWDKLEYTYDDAVAAFNAHVAAEIDEALGGLTQEEQWVPVEKSGHRWHPRDEALAHAALDLYGARGPMHVADGGSPLERIEHEARWATGFRIAAIPTQTETL